MPVRETFWNIPHWAEIGQYIFGLLTILVFGYGLVRRVRHWRLGKPERRMDRLGARIQSVLVQAFGQWRTARDVYAGIMHLLIFWSMFVLLIGTIVATVDWDVTRLFFGFQFLDGGLYVVYELVLDIFGLLLLVGLGMSVYRRYITRPAKLESPPGMNFAWDDAYVIIMLVLIALTGYLVEGLRLAVIKPDWAVWSPVGNAVAALISSLGDPTNRALHLTLWTVHALVAFVFIASIPFTKLFHIVAAPVNIFFRSLQPAGALAPARSSSWMGVKEWRDFTWKQLLDFETCLRCGRCQDNCPAYASGLSLSPRNLVLKLNQHTWRRSNGQSLHGEVITAEEIWACATCMACVRICPVFVDHVASIVDLRRYLVNEGQIDDKLQDALASLGRYGNSFGKSERMRALWTQSVEPKLQDARREPVEWLWFVGDYASYHPSLAENTRRTAQVFHEAGLDFGILYEGERNAGNDVRRVGEEGLFEMLAEKNMVPMRKSAHRSIVTTDPHTYNALKNEYPPDANGDRSILHYTELLDQLIASGRINLKNRLAYQVTYHDPCYLGRYNEVYSAPRRVIEATGCELVEMPRHHDTAVCCGAGGGRIWMEEAGDIKERPAENRVREAAALPGVSFLVTTCPKDLVMFQDAIKTAGLEGKLVVKDLIELVVEAMEIEEREG